jgi:prepilin-type N-terminal cleavage/methylation domain-containing protein
MPRERGFTLIELMVALVVGSLVLLLAHRVLTGVLDGLEQGRVAQAVMDRDANARRVLARAAGSLYQTAASADGFAGDPHRVAFSTWLEDEHGWLVARRVTLRVAGGGLVLDLGGPAPLMLRDSVRRLDLDYLLTRGASEHWVRAWHSDASAPEAIRVRIEAAGGVADTLLLLVGSRG